MPKVKKTKNNLRRQDKFVKRLSCDLTEAELAKYSQGLAETTVDIADEEGGQKSVKAEMVAKLKMMKAFQSILATKISRKAELRDVDVVSELDFDKSVYRETRLDTGEVVKERPIRDDERQENLDISDGKDDNF
jgi:hypothetical protein